MLDNAKLQALLSLSDSELRQKVAGAAIAAGADKYKTAIALADMTKLRGMMMSLTPEQINDLLSKLGPNAAAELAKKIDN